MNQIAVSTLTYSEVDIQALSYVLLSSIFIWYIDTVSGSYNRAYRSYDALWRILGETDMKRRLNRVSNAQKHGLSDRLACIRLSDSLVS